MSQKSVFLEHVSPWRICTALNPASRIAAASLHNSSGRACIASRPNRVVLPYSMTY
jgi:hypothetical protein